MVQEPTRRAKRNISHNCARKPESRGCRVPQGAIVGRVTKGIDEFAFIETRSKSVWWAPSPCDFQGCGFDSQLF